MQAQRGRPAHDEKDDLVTPDRSKLLVRTSTCACKPGRGVLIKGPERLRQESILRASVGLPLWDRGDGVIAMPSSPGPDADAKASGISAQRGQPARADALSHRHQCERCGTAGRCSGEVNLVPLAGQLGGLDWTPNWDQLQAASRQRIVVARALVNQVPW